MKLRWAHERVWEIFWDISHVIIYQNVYLTKLTQFNWHINMLVIQIIVPKREICRIGRRRGGNWNFDKNWREQVFLTKVCHAHIRVSKYLHFVHEFWVHHFSQIQCISKFFYFNLVYLRFITRMKYMDKVVKFLKHCLVLPVDS